jgi:diadenosine tetraphosphate (Ap4A) HIT family hydrolase
VTCDICARNASTERGENPFGIVGTTTDYVNLADVTPRLHWHLFPRYTDGPCPSGPVWNDPGFESALAQGVEPTAEEMADLRSRLLAALQDTNLTIERRFA